MSPIVDQESTFDDTEKGGNAHNVCLVAAGLYELLRISVHKISHFFAADAGKNSVTPSPRVNSQKLLNQCSACAKENTSSQGRVVSPVDVLPG
jgi:hypothetical protein